MLRQSYKERHRERKRKTERQTGRQVDRSSAKFMKIGDKFANSRLILQGG